MASIIAWLIGFLLVGVGCYILLLRFEGLVDRIKPHNLTIGQMTVDGEDNKSYAELLRARFNHHFLQPDAVPQATGFLEVLILDAPQLFQPKHMDSELKGMTFEVSGVNVSKLLQFFNQVAKPDQWVVEGDFQAQSNRALLALRLRRGERLIRTWYLERFGDTAADKSMLLEGLIDDAIFQLVYDFGNATEAEPDLYKWRRLIPVPTRFSSRAAVAAYFEARGALGRYYAQGKWTDLDLALKRLQALRSQMPEFADGLQLLGMALAEKRKDNEAIHVYDQLYLLLYPADEEWAQIDPQLKRRLLSIELLKATATVKLYTWQSTHKAISDLSVLAEKLNAEVASASSKEEKAAYRELLAQTAVQLSYTYVLYMSHIRRYTVKEVFANLDAPEQLQVTDTADITALSSEGSPEEAKRVVQKTLKKVARQYERWMNESLAQFEVLEELWDMLPEGRRRRAELVSRLRLAKGFANYRMAEFEDHDAPQDKTVFGEAFANRLDIAAHELRDAEAAHPNHYLVLQLLGLVYSEPRYEKRDLNIAEQYLERAIEVNPSDYFGHELFAGLLKRRIADRGVDLASWEAIKAGLAQAQKAIDLRERSGTAHLLRAEFQAMLVEIERDPAKLQQLQADLQRYMDQAERFLPRAFGRPNPDLNWVRIVAATRQLGEKAESTTSAVATGGDPDLERQKRFGESKDELRAMIDELVEDCRQVEQRWVAQQRVFYVRQLRERAERLGIELENATPANWRSIRIPLSIALWPLQTLSIVLVEFRSHFYMVKSESDPPIPSGSIRCAPDCCCPGRTGYRPRQCAEAGG